jgi:SAM-dependent methyltransferase
VVSAFEICRPPASRPPNPYLLAEIGDVQPGFALDAGCGHRSEAIWLAASGWQVTAVDFSATALEHGRSTADAAGADIAERIEWVEGDLGTWSPPPRRFDLVNCLYVTWLGQSSTWVRRLGRGVAPGGTLLLAGHRPMDPATGAPTPAAGQVQVSVDEAIEVLDSQEWQVVVAEDRPRAAVCTGVDAVVRAVRRSKRVNRVVGTSTYYAARSAVPQPRQATGLEMDIGRSKVAHYEYLSGAWVARERARRWRMQAAVGDRFHLLGNIVGQSERTGEIVEVRGAGGEPPYLVRFDDGHTSLVFPGPDAVIEHAR